jgi:polysaccharide biosynthesis transport protein
MSANPSGTPAFNLGDIYHTLFRHKWKILGVAALGFVAASVAYFQIAPTYFSEAKLLIRYVVDRTTRAATPGNDSQLKYPDSGGFTIISSEIEILTSRDLAEQVASAVGPDKILGAGGPEGSVAVAGAVVVKCLKVEVPAQSSIIRLTFTHPNPETAQKALKELVRLYQLKHMEIHNAVGIYEEFLSKQTDQLRSRLMQTESEIRKLKNTVHVISIEDSKKAYVEELSKIRQDLFAAEAELAERRSAVPAAPPAPDGTNTTTNAQPAGPANTVAGGPTNPAANPLPDSTSATGALTPDQLDRINAYNDLRSRLSTMQQRESELLLQYTEESPLVKSIRTQMAEVKKRKEAMERETPSLLLSRALSTGRGAEGGADNNLGRIMALEARVKVLNLQLDKIRTEALGIDQTEGAYSQLMRKRKQEEDNFEYYSKALELARIDEALGPGRVSNISVVESATPPARAPGLRFKIVMGILFGGLAAGLLLAFGIEMVFDQSIKRPAEMERKVRLPLFMWIPDLHQKKRPARPRLPAVSPVAQLAAGETAPPPAAETKAPSASPATELAPWDPEHALRAHYEALRDRLVTYFEVRNMTHKPKLVGVTGCSNGSGVSSISTGLAAVLSEGGDGNVLLVDMNARDGAVHPFYRGKPGHNLAEALEGGSRDDAQGQENLFVVSAPANDGRLPRILPKTFAHLVPRMKASDYDFIIFDMPPVGQTSATARLAGHMDMTLLVVEAEKDHVDLIKQAAASLREAKANVGTVLNKKRTYVPHRLIPEA